MARGPDGSPESDARHCVWFMAMGIIGTMKRTALCLKASQIARLKAMARETGAPMAELVRRAIDEFLDRRAARPKDAEPPSRR